MNISMKITDAVRTTPKPTQAGCTDSGNMSPARVQAAHMGSERPILAPM